MATKTVFYSFHYERDVHRVHLVRQIGAIEGQPLLASQEWETVRRGGQQAIINWIDQQISYKRAVVVLIGQETASRPWVLYEIQKAWSARKPLIGVRIHGLSSMGSIDRPGADPFKKVSGVSGVPVFDATQRNWQGQVDTKATYAYLANNLESWVTQAKTRS
ncbi:TIR domain-containing protein [Williamsia muralis]|uniref:TIR domain-containing protein n=1 Tax=Williamsia marianensis TaxID=85044 RepID=A0ABU4F254_WILMA|nr:TIR domain-containing protein [Williamsia muralis]MDV7137076.1 TIR domain-containing protein [Williamsia muralis]